MDKFRQTTKDDDYPIIYRVFKPIQTVVGIGISEPSNSNRAPARTISSAASFTMDIINIRACKRLHV